MPPDMLSMGQFYLLYVPATNAFSRHTMNCIEFDGDSIGDIFRSRHYRCFWLLASAIELAASPYAQALESAGATTLERQRVGRVSLASTHCTLHRPREMSLSTGND